MTSIIPEINVPTWGDWVIVGAPSQKSVTVTNELKSGMVYWQFEFIATDWLPGQVIVGAITSSTVIVKEQEEVLLYWSVANKLINCWVPLPEMIVPIGGVWVNDEITPQLSTTFSWAW